MQITAANRYGILTGNRKVNVEKKGKKSKIEASQKISPQTQNKMNHHPCLQIPMPMAVDNHSHQIKNLHMDIIGQRCNNFGPHQNEMRSMMPSYSMDTAGTRQRHEFYM